jgi:uncharacterized protein
MWYWDEDKRLTNLAKHGVDFADIDLFDWTTAMEIIDNRKDYGEVREGAYGLIGQRLHFVLYTWRDGRMRIIGLRKANKREKAIWINHAK